MKLIDERLKEEYARLEKEELIGNRTATLGKLELQEYRLVNQYFGWDMPFPYGFAIIESDKLSEFICTGEKVSSDALILAKDAERVKQALEAREKQLDQAKAEQSVIAVKAFTSK